VKSIENN